jgi:hypothetical protein
MAGAAAPFNADYRLLAESLLTSIGANVAAGPAPHLLLSNMAVTAWMSSARRVI